MFPRTGTGMAVLLEVKVYSEKAPYCLARVKFENQHRLPYIQSNTNLHDANIGTDFALWNL